MPPHFHPILRAVSVCNDVDFGVALSLPSLMVGAVNLDPSVPDSERSTIDCCINVQNFAT